MPGEGDLEVPPARAGGSLRRLLDADPSLGDGLDDTQRAQVREQVWLAAPEVPSGGWSLELLDSARSVRGEVHGFLLLTGWLTVHVEIAGRASARLIGPREVILLDRQAAESDLARWRWSALADSRVIVFDERLLIIGRRWPRLLEAILRRAAQQTRYASLQQAISQLPRVEDRLLAMFWSIADRHGVSRPDGVEIALSVTHDTLAQMIGARRPTVTLGLQSLAARGLIEPRPGGWLIDRSALSAL